MFYVWIIVIGIISVLWALWSLRGIGKNSKIIKSVKKELSTGRVVFQDREKNLLGNKKGDYSSPASSGSSSS